MIIQYFYCHISGGGEFTLFITGNSTTWPSTRPVFSGGNRKTYSLGRSRNMDFMSFVSGLVENRQPIKRLIWQSYCDKKLNAIFAGLKTCNASHSWFCHHCYDEFYKHTLDRWNTNHRQHIYSFSCDEKLGFSANYLEEYGEVQTIFYGNFNENNSNLKSDIENQWDMGSKITSCGTINSTYYIVMTKNAEKYSTDQGQTYHVKKSWQDVEVEISKGRHGMKQIITALCYNHSLKEYLVVMTQSTFKQEHKWLDWKHDCKKEIAEWIKQKRAEGYKYTIIFTDPTNDMNLLVMTSDETLSNARIYTDTLMKLRL